jgi:hypothetical protein
LSLFKQSSDKPSKLPPQREEKKVLSFMRKSTHKRSRDVDMANELENTIVGDQVNIKFWPH